jgi:signal recognition particle subunit SRP54
MFFGLTDKFQKLFSSFAKEKKLTEDNLNNVTQEVRKALLEADVHYDVASSFVEKVKNKVLGDKVLTSIKPKEQFIKIIYDELIELMGSKEKELDLVHRPAPVMLCGLQGSGKTTHAAKLAYYLKKKGKKVLLVACDLQRPAAVDQLRKLGQEIEVEVFSMNAPVKEVAKKAYDKALLEKFDVLIVDTAGRLAIDEVLMNELMELKRSLEFSEILFVVSSTIGQDAAKTAKAFDEKLNITGTILTMLDSDARAGAALSIFHITQKPILFEGVGEKIGDLQPFNPESMADRILGMGDVINLVRKAEEHFDQTKTEEIAKKIQKSSFYFSDYLEQMKTFKKMGSMASLMKMVPGVAQMMPNIEMPEKELSKVEAIILSMTKEERETDLDIIHTRRVRIAKGSGTTVDEVNRLIKSFKQMKQLIKNMPKKGFMPNIMQMMGGKDIWD